MPIGEYIKPYQKIKSRVRKIGDSGQVEISLTLTMRTFSQVHTDQAALMLAIQRELGGNLPHGVLAKLAYDALGGVK